MRSLVLTTMLWLALVVLAVAAPSRTGERVVFSAAVGTIELDGVSGDILILPADGDSGVVKLRADVTPRRAFTAEIEQEGNTLYLAERWKGSAHGSVQWVIQVPRREKSIRLRMSTASGELACKGLAARIDFSTASGDIELASVTLADGSSFSTASGEILLSDMTVDEGTEFSTASGSVVLDHVTLGVDCRFSTASGDVRAKNCTGYFELSAASGDVTVRDCAVTGRSRFSTASGDVELFLEHLPTSDLRASSASGNVLLQCGEFGGNFTLVMVAREDGGEISCPFDYTSEDTFEDDQGEVYEEKTVEQGTGRPEISLSTASGEVIVRE